MYYQAMILTLATLVLTSCHGAVTGTQSGKVARSGGAGGQQGSDSNTAGTTFEPGMESDADLTTDIGPHLMLVNSLQPCPTVSTIGAEDLENSPCVGEVPLSLSAGALMLTTSIGDLTFDGGIGKGGWRLTTDSLMESSADGNSYALLGQQGERLIFRQDANAPATFKSRLPALKKQTLTTVDSNTVQLASEDVTTTYKRITGNRFGIQSISAEKISVAFTRNSDGFLTSIQSTSGQPNPQTHTVNLNYAAGKLAEVVAKDLTAALTYENDFLTKVTLTGPQGSMDTFLDHDASTGLLKSMRSSTGSAVLYAFYQMKDASFAMAKVVDAVSNFATKYMYADRRHGMKTVSSTMDVTYDENGRPVRVEQNGLVWRTAYDALGRVISKIDQFGREQEFAYDDSDARYPNRLASALNKATGVLQSITYDSENRVAQVVTARGDNENSVAYMRDSRGNLTQTLVNGQLAGSVRAFDGKDRLGSIVSGGDTLTFQYDDLDRITAAVSAQKGPTTTEYLDDGEAKEVTRTDPFGNVTRSVVSDSESIIYRSDGTVARTIRDTNGGTRSEVTGPTNTYSKIQLAQVSGGNQRVDEFTMLGSQRLTGTTTTSVNGKHDKTWVETYLRDALVDPFEGGNIFGTPDPGSFALSDMVAPAARDLTHAQCTPVQCVQGADPGAGTAGY